MMDQLKVLRLYLACKAHFTTKYDIFKYKAAIRNVNPNTLNANKSRKYLIERLSKRFNTPGEVMGYIVPQWIYSYGCSLYEPIIAEDNYNRWQKFRISSDYILSSQLSDYDSSILVGDSPSILKYVKRDLVSIESAVALQKLYNWIDVTKDYFVDQQLCDTIIKSVGFLKFDEDKLRKEFRYEETA